MEAATQWFHRRNKSGQSKQLRSPALAQIKTFGAAKPLDLIFTLVKPIDFHELEQVLDQVRA
jgi:hypothetical protein